VDSREGARHGGRRARYLGALSVAAVGVAFFAVPGGASASSVNCSGNLRLNNHGAGGPYGINYTLKCSEDIQAYSIVSTKKLDYFTPDPLVLQPNGNPSATDHFNCEGPIPGPGFGCPGAMTAGNHVKASFATVPRPCYPAVRAWATVTTQQLDSHGVPFETSSQPFRLQGPDGCKSQPSPASLRRARAHHRHHHHRGHHHHRRHR
jgi:hypothetical protein